MHIYIYVYIHTYAYVHIHTHSIIDVYTETGQLLEDFPFRTGGHGFARGKKRSFTLAKTKPHSSVTQK